MGEITVYVDVDADELGIGIFRKDVDTVEIESKPQGIYDGSSFLCRDNALYIQPLAQ